jgi:peptidoglycan-associated lipoprotein
MKRLPLLALVVIAGVAVAAACGGGPKPQPPAPVANADSLAAAQRVRDSLEAARQDSIRRAQEEAERVRRQREADSLAAASRSTEEVRALLAAMIHFDFDKAVIRPEDAAILDQKVAILQANPNLRIRISGHCDERGSDEYNLALGNRRATGAKQYLVSHGIDAGRIETISYGEERPIAQGHDETAWAQNRRDEVEIISGGDVLKKP